MKSEKSLIQWSGAPDKVGVFFLKYGTRLEGIGRVIHCVGVVSLVNRRTAVAEFDTPAEAMKFQRDLKEVLRGEL